jgi:hypothetical protein
LFCGLHLLVGFADICAKAIGKFEDMDKANKDTNVDAAGPSQPLEKHQTGTLNLIRAASKVPTREMAFMGIGN